jgi:hypothetical protein
MNEIVKKHVSLRHVLRIFRGGTLSLLLSKNLHHRWDIRFQTHLSHRHRLCFEVVPYRSDYPRTCITAKIHALQTTSLVNSGTGEKCLSEAMAVVSAGFACSDQWVAIEKPPLRSRRLAGPHDMTIPIAKPFHIMSSATHGYL